MLEVGLSARLTTRSCPEEMPPSVPPDMVGQEAVGREFVAVLATALADDREPVADLDALHRVDAHHGVREVRVQPVEHRLAEARGHAASRRP